jgi:hypothetical protein
MIRARRHRPQPTGTLLAERRSSVRAWLAASVAGWLTLYVACVAPRVALAMLAAGALVGVGHWLAAVARGRGGSR